MLNSVKWLISILVLACVAPLHAAAQEKPPIPADVGDVKTTASGMKYCVLAPGKGPVAQLGDALKVHYTCWLTDGTVIDSSRARGQPFPVKVGASDIIKAWSEGLQLMSPGSRLKLTVPPELAWGASGMGSVPPNATVIFDIELLEAKVLPRFKAANSAKQKMTESGIKYETLIEGSGETFGEDKIYDLAYAMFNASGKLLTCSEEGGQPLKGLSRNMPIKFLQEFTKQMQVGGRYRLEVPPELAFGAQNQGPDLPANSTTVWELELVRVLDPLPLPAFALSAPDRAITTPSGLKYEVLREGSGPVVKKNERLELHYAGWHTDGRLVDSSYERADTMVMSVPGRVMKGWNEGLLLMREGSLYRFTLTPELAYGARGMPPAVEPNETLVYIIDVIKVGN